MLFKILNILNVKQYIKNIVCLLPLLFFLNEINIIVVSKLFYALCIFCITSSSVYLINDFFDYEYDKTIYSNSKKPIVIGLITKYEALTLSLLIFFFSALSAFLFDKLMFLVILLYFILNILYSLLFKNFIFIDALFIASGFILRFIFFFLAIRQNIVFDITLFFCFLLVIFLSSLFFTFNKRKIQVYMCENKNIKRKSIKNYQNLNFKFISNLILFFLSLSIFFCFYFSQKNILILIGGITIFLLILRFSFYSNLIKEFDFCVIFFKDNIFKFLFLFLIFLFLIPIFL